MNYPPFLKSELTEEQKTRGLFHVIPVPFEESVSYGGGTATGPSAILEASSQLEVWDGRGIPAERGIVTLDPITESPAEAMIEASSTRVFEVLESGSVPVTLGGEHTVSVGPFKALEKWSSLHGRKVGIVQIDAHADLRDSYEGSPLSHACVMRRAFDYGFPLYQIGVRSLSPPEVEFRRRIREEDPGRLGWLDAADAVRGAVSSISLPDGFPELIYLTIDIDGFDPSLFPATGTPEPGGLLWYQCIDMIESIASSRSIIGFDLVELAPVEGRNVDAFAAARLIYEIMGIVERN
jgi:agmatinase